MADTHADPFELYKANLRVHLESSPEQLIQGFASEPGFRFIFFASGSGTIRIARKTHSVISPCILCLSERESLAVAQLTGLRADQVYFRPEVINATFDFKTLHKNMGDLENTQGLDIYWLFPFLQSAGPLLIGPATAGRMAALLQTIDQELREQRGDFWPCRSRAVFYELLNLIARIDSERERVASGDVKHNPIELLAAQALDPDIETILSYLNVNYQRRITIPELTRHFGIDRTTLSKKFREATGRSILDYIGHMRVQMACLLLRDTNLPVADVLERVGFEDSTHFGRTFRKYTGQAPSAYRQEYR